MPRLADERDATGSQVHDRSEHLCARQHQCHGKDRPRPCRSDHDDEQRHAVGHPERTEMPCRVRCDTVLFAEDQCRQSERTTCAATIANTIRRMLQ